MYPHVARRLCPILANILTFRSCSPYNADPTLALSDYDVVNSVSSTEVSEPNTAGDVTSSATSTTFSASRAKWTSSEDKELAALFDEHGKRWKLIAGMMSGNWAVSTVSKKGSLFLKEKTKVRRML